MVQLSELGQRPSSVLKNIAIAPRGSASVLPGALLPNAAVWAATPESAAHDVHLQSYHFSSGWIGLAGGAGDVKLEGIRSYTFLLAEGPKKLHLTLGNSSLAFLSKGDEIVSVHWQGGEPFTTTVESSADSLTLLHTRLEEDRFAFEAIPLRVEDLLPPLALGVPYEQNQLRSGIERLAVRVPAESGKSPFALHIRGAAESVTYTSDKGQVMRGKDFTAPAGYGTLEIAHGAGLLLCWIDQVGNEAAGLWPETPDPAKAEIISLPAIRKLRAAKEVLSIKTGAPLLLRVRMSSPSISMLRRASGESEVTVHPNQTLMEAYLPEGISQLYLRSPGGDPLSGAVELTGSQVTPISEGLGPEVLLAPGDCRMFSFEAKQAGPVGIGVRASSDVVESELLSSSGKSLGKGTVQQFNLQPGIYMLALRAPSQGAPVRARPAIVGIVLPSMGPPEDVIRKYLASEETPSQFTSRRQAAHSQSPEYADESEPEGAMGDSESMEEPEEP
jgi:hypothetical protein